MRCGAKHELANSCKKYVMLPCLEYSLTNVTAVQGAGGGGILALGSIILSDLVPLKERGLYNGMVGL